MSSKYKGFWDPFQVYEKGDIVEYYSSKIEGSDGPYSKISSYVYTADGSTIGQSPLSNFKNPTTLSKSSPIEVSLTRDLLRSFVSAEGTWDNYKYYDSANWVGPHGEPKTASDGSFYLEEINSNYWDQGSNPKANWSDLDSYDASNQSFDSSSQTTLFQGKYEDAEKELKEEFDQVQGETDSDAYYISSVQNYKGNFDINQNYKKFDIVRNPNASSFYYARADISGVDEDIDFVLENVELREPTEYIYNFNHIGTIDYVGNDKAGWVTPEGNSFIRVGHTIDLSNFNREGNKRKFMVIGVSPDLIWLGSISDQSVDKEMVLFESVSSPGVDVTLSSGKINITDNDQIWSSDKFFFDADYGSSVKFSAANKKFEHGDGYESVSPFGINSLRMRFELEFKNRSNREANAILHFLENQFGQHENKEPSTQLEYNQGVDGFLMDGESLFFPYNTTENLTRKFHCFDFSHTIENEDVHSVSVKIDNSSASTLNVAHQIFVQEAPIWNSEDTYSKNSVVFCPDNSKYYYSKSESPQSSNRPWVVENEEVVSINKNIWTREFYWSPSIPFNIAHSPSIQEFGTSQGPYAQYYPDNQHNINLLEFDLTFENRSNEEAYAILHFLESHLGYLSFLFVPPAPYNRKRRFYCEEWSHTYVFRDNHTISAKFKQFPIGQNTPLDDDEIDNIAVKVKKKAGRLLISESSSLAISQNYNKSSEGFYAKVPIILKNDGETDLHIKDNISLSQDSSRLRILGWGKHIETAPADASLGSLSVANFNVSSKQEDSSVIYSSLTKKYIHTGLGALYEESSTADLIFKEICAQPDFLLESPADLKIAPGEEFVLHCEFNSIGLLSITNISDEYKGEIAIEYEYAPSEEVVFSLDYSDSEMVNLYTEGNIVQYEGKVYQASKDIPVAYTSNPASDTVSWSEYTVLTSFPVDIIVNPELIDAKKEELNISIVKDHLSESTESIFDIHSNYGQVSVLSQREKDLFFDVACSASGDGEQLAVPLNYNDIQTILSINTDIEGYVYLGVKYDFELEMFYSYYETGYSKISGDEIISEQEYQQLSDSDKNLYTRSSNLDLGGIEIDHNFSLTDGEFVALGVKSGKFIITSKNSPHVEGHVRQSFGIGYGKPLILSEYIASGEILEGRNLDEIKKINITLEGYFSSDTPTLPAISLGHGFGEESEINIYMGTEESACVVMGRGGEGGAGMISEGIIYEHGEATENNIVSTPPDDGQDGGAALYIDSIESSASVSLYLEYGAILGGGGGGGGGGYQGDQQRIKNTYLINIGGGGGAGCGGAIGGFPMGSPSSIIQNNATSGGQAVNNSLENRNLMQVGGNGGMFGQDGQAGGLLDNFRYSRVGKGGRGGNAISWGGESIPKVYVKNKSKGVAEEFNYSESSSGEVSFHNTSNESIQNLSFDDYEFDVAGSCISIVGTYKVTVNDVAGSQSRELYFKDKDLVNLTNFALNYNNQGSSYELDYWRVDQGDIIVENNKFIMPAKNIEITYVPKLSAHNLVIDYNKIKNQSGVFVRPGREYVESEEVEEKKIYPSQLIGISAIAGDGKQFKSWSSGQIQNFYQCSNLAGGANKYIINKSNEVLEIENDGTYSKTDLVDTVSIKSCSLGYLIALNKNGNVNLYNHPSLSGELDGFEDVAEINAKSDSSKMIVSCVKIDGTCKFAIINNSSVQSFPSNETGVVSVEPGLTKSYFINSSGSVTCKDIDTSSLTESTSSSPVPSTSQAIVGVSCDTSGDKASFVYSNGDLYIKDGSGVNKAEITNVIKSFTENMWVAIRSDYSIWIKGGKTSPAEEELSMPYTKDDDTFQPFTFKRYYNRSSIGKYDYIGQRSVKINDMEILEAEYLTEDGGYNVINGAQAYSYQVGDQIILEDGSSAEIFRLKTRSVIYEDEDTGSRGVFYGEQNQEVFSDFIEIDPLQLDHRNGLGFLGLKKDGSVWVASEGYIKRVNVDARVNDYVFKMPFSKATIKAEYDNSGYSVYHDGNIIKDKENFFAGEECTFDLDYDVDKWNIDSSIQIRDRSFYVPSKNITISPLTKEKTIEAGANVVIMSIEEWWEWNAEINSGRKDDLYSVYGARSKYFAGQKMVALTNSGLVFKDKDSDTVQNIQIYSGPNDTGFIMPNYNLKIEKA